jgi:hypothetical protein
VDGWIGWVGVYPELPKVRHSEPAYGRQAQRGIPLCVDAKPREIPHPLQRVRNDNVILFSQIFQPLRHFKTI